MKKIKSLLIALVLVTVTFAAKAQTSTAAYFAGKWNVLLKGTPDGDHKMVFIIENASDSLSGVIQDSTGAEISKISSIEQKENEITVYFNAQGYDVNVVHDKKDDDHATGSLMGMFDVDAERIKE
jgi:hypothetical protein